MKIKNDKLKLDPGERRLGNFIIKDEPHHVKVMDINQIFTHRADKRTPVGLFLSSCYEAMTSDESTGKGLQNWMAVMFTAFSVVPDIEFLETVMKASTDCMERHPEAYGESKLDGTDEEHDAAAQEVKEMMQFEEEVKNLPDTPDSPASE